MAELTGGQLVARTVRQAGVSHVFTVCGGHILPIYDGVVLDPAAYRKSGQVSMAI